MSGAIALVGGDEFRQGCEDMDRAVLEASGASTPSLLVLPTAAARENAALAAANGVRHFAALGANAEALMVLDSDHANDAGLLAPLESADVVYLTGGNPAHLLDVLSGSLLLDKLLDAHRGGAVLAGSSAGAMVLGEWMRFRGWRRALNVVPGLAVLPHHERADPEAVAAELADSAPPGVSVLGVDGKTGCLGLPGAWRVVGDGSVTLYHGGEWSRFSADGSGVVNF